MTAKKEKQKIESNHPFALESLLVLGGVNYTTIEMKEKEVTCFEMKFTNSDKPPLMSLSKNVSN